MKKSDLKTGMLVTNRDGETYMVFRNNCCGMDCFVSKNGWDRLDIYNEDLTCKVEGDCLDIVKVEKVIHPYELVDNNPETKTLWTRLEPKKMTVSEIEAILGHPVEIVSDT